MRKWTHIRIMFKCCWKPYPLILCLIDYYLSFIIYWCTNLQREKTFSFILRLWVVMRSIPFVNYVSIKEFWVPLTLSALTGLRLLVINRSSAPALLRKLTSLRNNEMRSRGLTQDASGARAGALDLLLTTCRPTGWMDSNLTCCSLSTHKYLQVTKYPQVLTSNQLPTSTYK